MRTTYAWCTISIGREGSGETEEQQDGRPTARERAARTAGRARLPGCAEAGIAEDGPGFVEVPTKPLVRDALLPRAALLLGGVTCFPWLKQLGCFIWQEAVKPQETSVGLSRERRCVIIATSPPSRIAVCIS